MKRLYNYIENKKFEEIMMILTAPHISVKDLFENNFVEEALNIKITNRLVNYHRREYEKLRLLSKSSLY